MASPPHISSNIQSLLHQLLQSQQTFQHSLEVFATEVSYLTGGITPPCFTHTSDAIPQISQVSFPQHPALINSTNLSPQSHHLHSQDQDPLHRPDLSLNSDSVSTPVFFAPIVKDADKTRQSLELLAHGSNFTTISEDSVIANLSIPDTEEQSAELIIQAKNLEAAPLADPPSIPHMIPQYTFPSCDSDPIASFSAISVCDSDLGFYGFEPCFDFILLASDLICSSCFNFELSAWPATVPSPEKMMMTTTSAALPRVSFVFDPGGTPTPIYNPSVGLSDSGLWVNFVFLTPDPVCSSFFKIEPFALATTGTSPEKTDVNTILVFDPGGISPYHEFSSFAKFFSSSTVTVCHTHLQNLLYAALPWAQRIGFHLLRMDLAEASVLGLQLNRSSLALSGPWLAWIEWAFAFIEWILSLENRLLLNCNAPAEGSTPTTAHVPSLEPQRFPPRLSSVVLYLYAKFNDTLRPQVLPGASHDFTNKLSKPSQEFIKNKRAINTAKELPKEFHSEFLFVSQFAIALAHATVSLEMSPSGLIQLINRSKVTLDFIQCYFDHRMCIDMFAYIIGPAVDALSPFLKHVDEEELLLECIAGLFLVPPIAQSGLDDTLNEFTISLYKCSTLPHTYACFDNFSHRLEGQCVAALVQWEYWKTFHNLEDKVGLHGVDNDTSRESLMLSVSFKLFVFNVYWQRCFAMWCCCNSGDNQLLVYDYISIWNSADMLKNGKKSLLDWPISYKIVSEAAKEIFHDFEGELMQNGKQHPMLIFWVSIGKWQPWDLGGLLDLTIAAKSSQFKQWDPGKFA